MKVYPLNPIHIEWIFFIIKSFQALKPDQTYIKHITYSNKERRTATTGLPTTDETVMTT